MCHCFLLSARYVFYFLCLITLIEGLEFENKEPFAGKKKDHIFYTYYVLDTFMYTLWEKIEEGYAHETSKLLCI